MYIPQIGPDPSKSHSYFVGKRSRYPQIGQISGECEIDGPIQHSGHVTEEEDAYRLESNILSTI